MTPDLRAPALVMGDPFLRTLYDQESERKRPEVHGIVVVLHHFGVALLEQTLQAKEADGMQAHGFFSFPFCSLRA